MFFPDQSPPTLQALKILWAEHAGIFIGSLLITLLMTPVCRSVAVGLRIYDMPDQGLKTHGRPIPYLGGLAMFLGVVIPLAMAIHAGWVQNTRALWAVLAGILIITATGLLDDLISLKPIIKIVAQVTAALVLLYGGVIFRGIPTAIGDYRWIPDDSSIPLIAGAFVQVLLVVAACNATNLLDGLDGLCSGVTAIIATGFLLLATSIAAWSLWGGAPQYQFAPLIILISMALLGAALGFLPYNFNPASIFMGDAGSMLMGFVCAVLVTMFAERPGMLKWVLGALLIFGMPLFDTSLAFTRRWLNGKPVFLGDRSHFYDQLVDRGLSVKQAVMVCYALASTFVLLGVGSIFIRTRYSLIVCLATCFILAIIVTKAGMLRVDSPARGKPLQPAQNVDTK